MFNPEPVTRNPQHPTCNLQLTTYNIQHPTHNLLILSFFHKRGEEIDLLPGQGQVFRTEGNIVVDGLADDLAVGVVSDTSDRVPCCLGPWRGDRHLLAHQLVEQGALAHVRPADQGHEPGTEAGAMAHLHPIDYAVFAVYAVLTVGLGLAFPYLLVAFVLLVGLLYALPNTFPQDPVIEVTG